MSEPYEISPDGLETLSAEVPELGTTARAATVVAFGSVVEFRDEATGQQSTYTLVSSTDAAAAEGRLSADSPVAKALRGARAGDLVSITTPRGERKLHIVSVS